MKQACGVCVTIVVEEHDTNIFALYWRYYGVLHVAYADTGLLHIHKVYIHRMALKRRVLWNTALGARLE
jgi:hypothetical protein